MNKIQISLNIILIIEICIAIYVLIDLHIKKKLYKEEKIGISNNKYIVLISIFIGIFYRLLITAEIDAPTTMNKIK